MFATGRALLIAMVLVAVSCASAPAQTPEPPKPPAAPGAPQTQTPPTEADKATAEKKAKETRESSAKAEAGRFQGHFAAEVLAGGSVNDFRVPQPSNRINDVQAEIRWLEKNPNPRLCPDFKAEAIPTDTVAKAPDHADTNKTAIGIVIPAPPCSWPLTQNAWITVTAQIEDVPGRTTLFSGALPVSMFWFPLILTLVVLALIYPGGAAASWLVSRRQYGKKLDAGQKGEPVPTFWAALDPVELTKNPYGRASIAKLQIFTFSFIVFGLLLFNVLRTGFLVNMSADVLYLMGSSAVGAAGGKLTYIARRRLSLENWAWLRHNEWLGYRKDVAPRAKWSELFVDSDTKEFDPYRFQMAIFSLVVAIALVKTSASSLEAFKIPPEMLTLLGLSQVVFIGGQAIDKTGYDELDKKLTELRQLDRTYIDAKADADKARSAAVAAAAPGAAVAKTDAETRADAARDKYNEALARMVDMFIGVYSEQIDEANVRARALEMKKKA